MKAFQETQQELYALLKKQANHPFFLKKIRSGSCLFISDIARYHPEINLDALSCRGYSYALENGLMQIGFTKARWQKEIEDCPSCMPAFPPGKEKLESYALACLLLSHPGDDWAGKLLPACYRLTACKGQEETIQARALLREAAVLLRQGKLHCHAGGRLLTNWINKGESL